MAKLDSVRESQTHSPGGASPRGSDWVRLESCHLSCLYSALAGDKVEGG